MHTDKKKLYIFLAPLAAAFIMCVFYSVYGIFPFGSKTAAWCDLDQQTIPLLMELKDILCGKSSILYSAKSGGGMNFWGVFLFFLASPFYLAVRFIPKQDMSYFVTVLLIIKISLCALTASFYFSSAFEKLRIRFVILFGLIYAFCGYALMYYQSLVWLDIMYMFPLLIFSAERLCFQKKCGFYIFMLSASVAVSYYLSYMIVIFLAIAIPLLLRIRCRENASSARFAVSSLAAAFITAPVWLCTFLQVRKSARSLNNLVKLIFEPLTVSLKDKLCVIITDAFVFAAILFIIKSPLLKKSRVRFDLTVLIFLMIPVFIDPVNKFWHFGGYQGFPLRFGYMIVFFMLSAVCSIFEEFHYSGKSSPVCIALSCVLLTLFAVTAVYVVSSKKKVISSYTDNLAIDSGFFKTLFGMFLFAFLLYSLFIMLLRNKLLGINVFYALVSGVFITSLFVNMSVYIGFAAKEDDLFRKTMSLENDIDIAENSLYRVKTEKKYFHVNMLGALGLNNFAHYTSLNPQDYMFTMKELGYSSYWMETGANGGTLLTDALLGIKYSIGYDSDFGTNQKNLNIDSHFSAAENLLCVPAGVISNIPPENTRFSEYTRRIDVQKAVARQFFGSDNMIHDYQPSDVIDGVCEFTDDKYTLRCTEPDIAKCRLVYNLNITGKEVLYLDLFNELDNRVSQPFYHSIKVSVNGNVVSGSFPEKKDNGLLKLGEFENESVKIVVTLLKDFSVKSFGVFGIDTDTLKGELAGLNTSEPVLDGNVITANLSARENEYLYLAVPWDSGLTAYLNGNKTQLLKVNGCFCALKLAEDENQLKIVFYPEGFRPALILAVLGAAAALLICFKGDKFFENKITKQLSSLLCRMIFTAVSVIVYAVPVIIYAAGLFIIHFKM